MSAECYPMSVLPHTTRLYADYLAIAESDSLLAGWYGAPPASPAWMNRMNRNPAVLHAARLADTLTRQNASFGASPAALANIEKLRAGARAVVTGQQVGLLGGPLLTLLKAATAIARAAEATAATGIDHVPIFWLASEDHDLDEVDQISLPGAGAIETLRLGLKSSGQEVGGIPLGPETERLLDQAGELLGYAPICDLLRDCYTPQATLAGAFARLMARLFAAHGLIVVDANTRDFHALGAPALGAAIERAPELEAALLERSRELQAAGYHSQVLVKPNASLLFLVDDAGSRLALRRSGDAWKAGQHTYSTGDLLTILEAAPERLSPNALLRPIFQGHHSAHLRLYRRPRGDRLLRPVRGRLSDYSWPHHTHPAALLRHPHRAGRGHGNGSPRDHPGTDLRSQNLRSSRPASRRPRHAHRRQA